MHESEHSVEKFLIFQQNKHNLVKNKKRRNISLYLFMLQELLGNLAKTLVVLS